MPFAATWMDLEIIILSKVSQTQKEKYYMLSLMWNLIFKKVQRTYLQNRNRLTDIKNKLMVMKGETLGGGIVQECQVCNSNSLTLEILMLT